jgi:hypothetical protein
VISFTPSQFLLWSFVTKGMNAHPTRGTQGLSSSSSSPSGSPVGVAPVAQGGQGNRGLFLGGKKDGNP